VLESCGDALKGSAPKPPARNETAAEPDSIVLENANHKLQFDPRTARLLSFRAQAAPEQEFVVSTVSRRIEGIQLPVSLPSLGCVLIERTP